MLIWSEKYETGHPAIDAQHRELINYINRLEGLLNITNITRQDCELIVSLVNFVEDYTNTHFSFEEQCMEDFKCPAREMNQQAHNEFRQFFRDFKLRFDREGFHPAILRQLHQNASSWILGHILKIDRQIRTCVKNQELSGTRTAVS